VFLALGELEEMHLVVVVFLLRCKASFPDSSFPGILYQTVPSRTRRCQCSGDWNSIRACQLGDAFEVAHSILYQHQHEARTCEVVSRKPSAVDSTGLDLWIARASVNWL